MYVVLHVNIAGYSHIVGVSKYPDIADDCKRSLKKLHPNEFVEFFEVPSLDREND
jgi:hypothetical protein